MSLAYPAVAQDSPRQTVAASYERVSTFQQARHGYSLGAQAKDAAQFAVDNAWTLPDSLRFQDTDSGAGWDLPELNRMLDAARQKEFQVLIVPDLDRFARNMVKALVLEEQLRKQGVRVVYIRLPLEDTPEGRLLKNQLHSISEYEREKITLRTGRGRREKAERGLVVGTSTCPYGYRYVRAGDRNRIIGLAVDEPRASVVRRIFAEAREESVDAIAANLNRDGVPGTTGKPWSYGTILFMLHNPTYRGTLVYGRHMKREGIVIPVPAIVSPEDWAATSAAIERRRNIARKARTPHDAFELRSFITCGPCGGPLSSYPKSARYRYYVCLRRWAAEAHGQHTSICSLPAVHAHLLEDHAWQLVTRTVLDPDWLTAGLAEAQKTYNGATERQRERVEILEREIARQRARLQRVIQDRLDSEPGGEIYQALSMTARDIEVAITRLSGERAVFATTPAEGISPEDAETVCRFAAEVRDGIAVASPDERRRIYTVLQLRATIGVSEDGIQFGRHKFSIEWTARVPLASGDRNFLAFTPWKPRS